VSRPLTLDGGSRAGPEAGRVGNDTDQ